jgi:hypothetical protein
MHKDDAIRLRKAAAWGRQDGGYNILPGTSKTDPLCKIWGSDVAPLPRPCGGPLDASSSLRSLPAAPCTTSTLPRGRLRASEPYPNSSTTCLTRAAAVKALSPDVANNFSTHSFRISVATRLAAAGCCSDYIR